MKMMDIALLSKFYGLLQDDESRYLFDLRMKYMVNRNVGEFNLGIAAMNKKWKIIEDDDFSKYYKGQKIILWGAGPTGRMAEKVLASNGYAIDGYCDNDNRLWGGNIHCPNEFLESKEEYFFIICSMGHGHEIYRQILSQRIASRDNVFLPLYGAIYAICDNQYFDCPHVSLQPNEIFVDMGMYDGLTSKYVVDNCKYKEIIGFEANKFAMERCRNNLQEYDNIEIYPFAAWDKEEALNFSVSDAASSVRDSGSEKVIGQSLDNVLDGGKATFIKMDIEGAEAKALQGATNTIKLHKPKLAISIYHKPEDIIEIPMTIMNIRDDYKYYMRHYCAYNTVETILYAY